MAKSKKKARRSKLPARDSMRLIIDHADRIQDMPRAIRVRADEIAGQIRQLMAVFNELSYASRKLGRPVRSMLQRTIDTIDMDIQLLLIQHNRVLSAGEDHISETQKSKKPNKKTPKKNEKR